MLPDFCAIYTFFNTLKTLAEVNRTNSEAMKP